MPWKNVKDLTVMTSEFFSIMLNVDVGGWDLTAKVAERLTIANIIKRPQITQCGWF